MKTAKRLLLLFKKKAIIATFWVNENNEPWKNENNERWGER